MKKIFPLFLFCLPVAWMQAEREDALPSQAEQAERQAPEVFSQRLPLGKAMVVENPGTLVKAGGFGWKALASLFGFASSLLLLIILNVACCSCCQDRKGYRGVENLPCCKKQAT